MEHQYPPDKQVGHLISRARLTFQLRPGEAAKANGRVWKIYRDRVKDIDEDLLEAWTDTLNMLLVFVRSFHLYPVAVS